MSITKVASDDENALNLFPRSRDLDIPPGGTSISKKAVSKSLGCWGFGFMVGGGELQKESQREVKENYLAFFQLATARIKFISLKIEYKEPQEKSYQQEENERQRSVSGGNEME